VEEVLKLHMTVTITFRTPSSEYREEGATIHERQLEAVPRSTDEDFVQYRTTRADSHRSILYRYEGAEDDVLVALDFEEIVALTASGG
jgi:hypothetical protein